MDGGIKLQSVRAFLPFSSVEKRQLSGALQLLGVVTVAASFVVGVWAFHEHRLAIWITVIVGFSLIELGRRMKGTNGDTAGGADRMD